MSTADPTPAVDLVVAVHSTGRPVERAVASVLDGTRSAVRVTVVCHNIGRAEIAGKLGFSPPIPGCASSSTSTACGRPRARSTGAWTRRRRRSRRSWAPTTCWNRARSTPGRGRACRRRRRRGHPASACGRSGRPDATRPPGQDASPGRDPRQALVPQRSAGARPSGGVPDAPPDGGAPVGGDIAFVLALWFSRRRISYDRTGPAYVIGADAVDRVTFRPKPVAEEFTYLPSLVEAEWFMDLPARARASYAVKFLRVQVFGAVHNRPDPAFWTREERDDLRDATRRCSGSPPVRSACSPSPTAVSWTPSWTWAPPSTASSRSARRGDATARPPLC